MSYSAVLFDLDGTLLDTLADIAAAANRVLAQHGAPTYPVAAYRHFVGEGVRVLFERSLPQASGVDETLAACVDQFREAYAQCWNDQTRPYDGIEDLLGTLVSRGVSVAVLSNKPDVFTKACVQEYFPTIPFVTVLGQREGVPRKPDPAAALEIASLMNLPVERILYVGDTAVDMQTATGAGMFPIGVLWGFRPREELVASGARELIAHPRELLERMAIGNGHASDR